jgi:hypothetical protein
MRTRSAWLVAALAVGLAVLAGSYLGATNRPLAPGVSPSAAGPGTLGPPVTLAPGATPLVPIDPLLLAVLPGDVDGLSVLESSEGDADAASNASLALIADAAVGAFAIDPGSGDFVYALVVRLRPGALDDTGFRNWRDAYDAGACAGVGVGGHAEARIGGRSVFIGTCAQGLRTYHAWIADRQLLISASSGGDRGLGQVLFENLRPDAG